MIAICDNQQSATFKNLQISQIFLRNERFWDTCNIILVIQDARSELSDVLIQAIKVTEKL